MEKDSGKPKTAPSNIKQKPTRFPVYFAAAFTLVLGLLYLAGYLDTQESHWIDGLYIRNFERLKTGDPRIILATVEDDTIQRYGWPFTRDRHADLIDRLTALGVKTIVFDVMFLDEFKGNSQGDRRLVQATRRSKRTVHLGVAQVEQAGSRDIWVTRRPFPGLAEASLLLGHPNVDENVDADGHIRRMQLFSAHHNEPGTNRRWATLDGAALAAYSGKGLEHYRKLFDPPSERVFLNFRRSKDWEKHPLQHEKDPAFTKMVGHFYQPVSVEDILSGELSNSQKESLKGALVLVGSTAVGLYDHYPSPFSKITPGMEFHATLIDNILNEDYLVPTGAAVTLLVTIAFIWLPLLVLRLPPVAAFGVMGALLAGWLGYTHVKFLHQVRYDVVTPLVGLVVSFLVMTVRRVLTEGAEKKFIKQTFGQFVAPEVVEKLVKDPSLVRLGGEKREMTVFFLDIAHFTTISEKMDPESLILFLNRYLSALSKVVQDHKGVVDKYIGDCIMAFWNAPLDDPAHKENACITAVECQKVLQELNKDLDPKLPERPAIRIGLNSGDMTVGLTGSEKKLAYTVIGDEVNLASRLEGANKFFGSGIMVSEACYEGGKAVAEARILGSVRVVGKAIPIKVFELVGLKGQLSPEWQKVLPLYEKGVELFLTEKFAEAKETFIAVLKLLPEDKPSKLYLNACEDYVAIPPMGDWRVFNLTSK